MALPISALLITCVLRMPLAYLLYFLLRSVYRLTFHPLAKFPGPKITAITHWYEVYYQVWRPGQMEEQIRQMHRKYGPIVRITPDELHINDPDFYDQIYNISPSINRPSKSFDNLQHSPAFELHRVRRRALEPYFTKPAVIDLEGVIKSCVEEFCNRLDEAKTSKRPINASILTRCLTSDIISEYIFAQPYGFLKSPKRSEAFFAANYTIFSSLYLFRESRIVNFLVKSLNTIPPALLPSGHIAHSLAPFMDSVISRLKEARRQSGKEVASAEHRVLFNEYHTLVLPKRDLELDPSLDTALLFITAGFETVANTLETVFYHVLSDRAVTKRLQDELKKTSPNASHIPDWSELEKLPYLTAVISEALRLSVGVTSRLPRSNVKEDMIYHGWVIPRGSFVGMSQQDILYNDEIFPEPRKFDPERWLKGDESTRLLKHLVSFSKGARRCIGIHLAYAELYITLATVFRRYKLELYDTKREDVEPVLDFFIPKPADQASCVRLLVS